MKILDRHVLFSFLRNYFISLMVLIGLYVVLDMVFAFDEFVEVQGKSGNESAASVWFVVRHILNYYAYQVFLIFAYLSGIIPVVAAAFTLIRLIRFNEMTAILAAGVPLLRVAAPIILCGLVLNLVLLPINQELIIPRMIPMLIRGHDQPEAASRAFPIRGLQDQQNRLLVAARYNPPTDRRAARMEYMSVIERDADLRPLSHTSADAAVWDEASQQWRLTNGKILYDLTGEKRSPEQPMRTYRSNITPEEIALYRSGDYVELLPTARINQLLARRESYGTTDLLRVKHTRFAQPVLNFILLLLACVCLLTRDPSQVKGGIMRCAAVTALCMGAIFLSQQLAGHPQGGAEWIDRWPAIMAWMPILIFGPVAVWLLDRVNTHGS